MTATEKIIENNRTNKIIYSMDDEIIFGKIIDVKTINWAIEHKKITDYNLIILKNTEEEINNTLKSILTQKKIYTYSKQLIIICDGKIPRVNKNDR